MTLSSDQAATDVLFARPDDGTPATMRVFRHAIVLDVDCYEAPVFSADGRYLAIRGNAYVQSLDVFEFPTMRRVLHTTLGKPYPGHPCPPEWEEEQALSRHNIAFAAGSGVLLVGTSWGSVIVIDLEGERAAEHRVTAAPISALAVMSTGRLVVADRSGRLTVTDAPGDVSGGVRPAAAAAARERVDNYLAATTELPDGADLDASLVRNDGRRTWDFDDLETLNTADDAEPTWLRLRAAVNALRRTGE
ncbi:hypothetical protein [Polymorphospora rubra]|uniref:hypothetical protein n=1 Tax=Polymorphospora rubra TaxID=338584 RepID=UPI0033CBFE51